MARASEPSICIAPYRVTSSKFPIEGRTVRFANIPEQLAQSMANLRPVLFEASKGDEFDDSQCIRLHGFARKEEPRPIRPIADELNGSAVNKGARSRQSKRRARLSRVHSFLKLRKARQRVKGGKRRRGGGRRAGESGEKKKRRRVEIDDPVGSKRLTARNEGADRVAAVKHYLSKFVDSSCTIDGGIFTVLKRKCSALSGKFGVSTLSRRNVVSRERDLLLWQLAEGIEYSA
ncbi:hypothetical protein KM043_002925 [Ampulex compressa]|nr:hypothetical protein KM043_002925 [Ampulex compressa]